MDSLHFSLHFHSQARKEEVDSGDGSALYSDLHKRKPLLEIPFNLTFLHFHQKLNSPSILQKKYT